MLWGLSGGISLTPGFHERLMKELAERVPSTIDVNVIAPAKRQFSAWVGGSILSSLSAWKSMWVTKDHYDEVGPTAFEEQLPMTSEDVATLQLQLHATCEKTTT